MAIVQEESIQIGRIKPSRRLGGNWKRLLRTLVVRVVGSLLYGQATRQWQLFQEFGFANIKKDDDGIMPILKLSYYQLESSLKSCFGYCALFPKDFKICKKKLICLWMAQGFITPEGSKSIEEVAEEYVSILIDRCFFQDVEASNHSIISFKIHDLMHDVAQGVVGKEICTMSSINGDVDKEVRHLSLRVCSLQLKFCSV